MRGRPTTFADSSSRSSAKRRDSHRPFDWTVWAIVTPAVTSLLLAVGRYRLIERVSIMLVGTFTLVTLAALAMLQFDPAWAISWHELAAGVVPSIPPAIGGRSPLTTALGTFGIIGVGAAELMFYPYWCLEKGFAVLYSTLIAAADGNARIIADGLALAGWIPRDDAARRNWTRRIAVVWRLVALVLALLVREPVATVLASGVAQAIMLVAIGVAVLFFRHGAVDSRLAPSRLWEPPRVAIVRRAGSRRLVDRLAEGGRHHRGDWISVTECRLTRWQSGHRRGRGHWSGAGRGVGEDDDSPTARRKPRG